MIDRSAIYWFILGLISLMQAELDALRAKRAMEQSERLAREKERREAEFKVLKQIDIN